jgi:hypothetical protein
VAVRNRSLFVRPEVITFEASEEHKFVSTLEKGSDATAVLPLGNPEEMQLDAEGRLKFEGEYYRYTASAFRQICQLIAPGLSRLIPNLAGERRAAKDRYNDDIFALDSAIQVFNTILDLRFPNLEGKRVVRNTDTKQVEGLIGHKHQFLSNYDLYIRAAEMAEGMDGTEFDFAKIAGSRMMARFVGEEPLFHVNQDKPTDPFYAGFHFSNSEKGGASVRAGQCFIRELTGTSCLGNLRSLPHSGKDFYVRLERILSSSMRPADPDNLRRKAAILQTKLLLVWNQEEKHDEEKMRDKCKQHLTSVLQQQKLTATRSRQLVNSAMAIGSYDKEGSRKPAFKRKREMGSRTNYDMFNAITREAARLPIGVQERLEQVAFDLLIGKFDFY